jgi:hypothetical protein
MEQANPLGCEKYARVPNNMRRIKGGVSPFGDFRKANRPPLALIT